MSVLFKCPTTAMLMRPARTQRVVSTVSVELDIQEMGPRVKVKKDHCMNVTFYLLLLIIMQILMSVLQAFIPA